MITWNSYILQLLSRAQVKLSLQRRRYVPLHGRVNQCITWAIWEAFHNPNSYMAIQVCSQLGKQFTKWCLKRSDANHPHSAGKGFEWLLSFSYLLQKQPCLFMMTFCKLFLFQNSKYSFWLNFSGYKCGKR